MKFHSSLIHEFSAWQRIHLEALFIVLDWSKEYQKRYPNNPAGQEWLNATELTMRIIYDDAFSAIRNRGIAFHSGSDTTEAPPEIIRCVIEELAKHSRLAFVDRANETSNCNYLGRPSTSSETNNTSSDMVNFMYFGPAYEITESTLGNSSTEDIPFGFQFPHLMHFNFDDKKQETSMNFADSSSTLSCQSFSDSEQKETFSTTYIVRPTINEKILHQKEMPEILESTQLDLTKYSDFTLECQSSNPAIEFFRISSGFIPPPKYSDIAERQCTSPFCLCSSIRRAYRNESNEDFLENDEEISEDVSIEPYLEVENINFPKLELPDSLDDTSESFMALQPFNTPDDTEELEISSESALYESITETSFSNFTMPGTPRNNPDDKELMLQPFNTPVSLSNISGASNNDTSLNDSLGVADLGLDEDISKILARKFSIDNDQEYIRQERLRILSSYEKSRLMEQKKLEENEREITENKNFATSTPNWHGCHSSRDKYRKKDY